MKTKKTVPQQKLGGGFTAVASRCYALTCRLSTLRDLKGPKQAREWLDLSLSEVGREIGKAVRHDGKPFDKSIVYRWETGEKTPTPDVVRGYCDLISDKLSFIMGRTLGVQIEVNSPWKVTALGLCSCGQWFKLHDAKSKRCPKCVKGGKR
jgi:hypothetical protein